MCNKLSSAKMHAPCGGFKFMKTLAIIAFFCLSECTAGSCLKYGHSCWGGHGKRSDATINHISENDPLTNDLPNDMKWFLQKLLQANDYSSNKGRDSLPRNIRRLLKEMSNDDDMRSNEDGESTEEQQDDVSAIEKMFRHTGDTPLRLKDAEGSSNF